MPTLQPHSTTVGTETFTIWGDTTLVNAYFGLDPDASAGPTNVSRTVPPHTRRRYPGDASPAQVDGYTAVASVDTPATQQTTPGKAFTVEEVSGTAPNIVRTVHQFTCTGTFKSLRTLADGAFAEGVYLRSYNGVLYDPVAAP